MLSDIAGRRLYVGDLIVAPYEERLHFGLIVEQHPEAGSLTVELHNETFTEPIRQLYLFSNTQLLWFAGNTTNPFVQSLLQRSQEIKYGRQLA